MLDNNPMKNAHKYLAIMSLGIAALSWLAVKVASTEGVGEVELDDPAEREAFRRLQLQDENGQIPPNALTQAYEHKRTMEFLPEAWSEFLEANEVEVVKGTATGVMEGVEPGAVNRLIPWVSIGPGNIGGRIRSIIIHPTATPRTMWVGGVSGGVWKTTNAGTSWSTNTDSMANLAVNCMAIDPANPNVLYAGTGEGFSAVDAVRGNGIFKTTDGGNTWNQLLFTKDNADFYWVNRLAISPTNSQLLLAAVRIDAAAAYGKILRSTNGGETWSSLAMGAPMNDIRFKPNSIVAEVEVPDVPAVNCVAASQHGHVYYSTDNGVTWTPVSGLPAPAPFQRVELAYSRGTPSIVYASVASTPDKLYRSTNGGLSFTSTGSGPSVTTDFYHNSLWVDPIDPNRVLVGGLIMNRSTDGGLTWVLGGAGTHLDHHAMVEDPGYNGTSNQTVYGGNDGGIYRTTNVLESSPIWTSLNNNLGVTQFYGAAGHVASGRIIGGTQDNNTVLSPASGSQNWTPILGNVGGDGGFCAVDQTANPYFYGEFVFLQICRSVNGGMSKDYIWNDPSHGIPHEECSHLGTLVPCANFIAPFVLDPNNENRMLGGGKSLWRSNDVRNTDSLPSWAEIKPPIPQNCTTNCVYINAIAVAPGQPNIIWVGHNNGTVYRTVTGTSVNPIWLPATGNLPQGNRFCTRITIAQGPQLEGQGEPPAPVTKYVTFGGFNGDNIWKTSNEGVTWTNIHHNLPVAPIYSLVVSPSNPEILYVGTEVGVFSSADSGVTWSPGVGDPNAPVMELFWMGPKLVAATHGRGMFTLGGEPPTQ